MRNIIITIIIIGIIMFFVNMIIKKDRVHIYHLEHNAILCDIESNKKELHILKYDENKIIDTIKFKIAKESLLLVTCNNDYVKFDCISNDKKKSKIIYFKFQINTYEDFEFEKNNVLCKIRQNTRTHKYKIALK